MHFSRVNRSLETPHRLIQSSEIAQTNPCSLTHSLPPHFLIHSLTPLSSSLLCFASCWFLINHVTLFWAFKCLRPNLVQLMKGWTLGKRERKWNSVVALVLLGVCTLSILSLLGPILYQRPLIKTCTSDLSRFSTLQRRKDVGTTEAHLEPLIWSREEKRVIIAFLLF